MQGPLSVPRTPQAYPVIVQAGASPAGRDFAARWADVIFCSHESLETAIGFYADMKARAARHGRDPAQLKILPAATTVIGLPSEVSMPAMSCSSARRFGKPLSGSCSVK